MAPKSRQVSKRKRERERAAPMAKLCAKVAAATCLNATLLEKERPPRKEAQKSLFCSSAQKRNFADFNQSTCLSFEFEFLPARHAIVLIILVLIVCDGKSLFCKQSDRSRCVLCHQFVGAAAIAFGQIWIAWFSINLAARNLDPNLSVCCR